MLTEVISFVAPMVQMFEGEAGWNGLTGDMFLGVLTDIKALLPIAAPAVIGFIAFRKGWAWLKGQIKGA